MEEQHTISVLVANKFGAPARIAGLFSGRGYNIESLTVNRTHNPALSRMTIVTTGDDAVLEQIEKQLTKLVDVEAVVELDNDCFVERELVLVKVRATRENRAEILNLVEIFGARIPLVLKDEIALEPIFQRRNALQRLGHFHGDGRGDRLGRQRDYHRVRRTHPLGGEHHGDDSDETPRQLGNQQRHQLAANAFQLQIKRHTQSHDGRFEPKINDGRALGV